MTGLLRPYGWSFAAVVILQVIGAVAGLAPLLAVVELGRVLLSSGPVDHGHVWFVVVAGAVGLSIWTAAESWRKAVTTHCCAAVAATPIFGIFRARK